MMSRLEHPIVLAHGLLGFAQVAVRGITLATYFRLIPRYLERSGNRVVLTQVPATSSIAARAEALKQQIAAQVGTEPVHVMAHSMGGLDARYMITVLGMASQVRSLTTLGTPHRGTAMADVSLRLARWSGVLQLLANAGIDSAALTDLTTASCARFNDEVPNSPSVRYFSVGGAKRRHEMLYALRFGHDVIAPVEGPNDGLVSVRSAQWGERFVEWNCDHVNMVGWTGPRERLGAYSRDVRPEYGKIVQQLKDCGF